ncbi:MAG: Ldh family oxidoreductase [Alphaproteobacteria bacterium]|nr:Ldh family oxidoreductase [Alphaproteobacteria bacterium]
MTTLAARVQALAGRKSIDAVELAALATDILAGSGFSSADARLAADILCDAQLRGSQSHGLMHLPVYLRGLLDGSVNAAPRYQVDTVANGTAVVDADNALGVLAGAHVIDLLVPIARRQGIAAAAVRNSNHFGVAGYFVERATQQGLICMVFSNASPTMAPTGATEALFGTNPIAFGCPMPGADPVIMDMATSGVARARIRQAWREGRTIPSDWALDAAGRPTTDPAAALKGTIQPLGGAKGYGLALVADLLSSALADGRPGFDVVSVQETVGKPAGVSHFFVVIDPAGFAGAARYDERAGAIAARVASTVPIDAAAPVRMPGSRGHETRRHARRDGVPLTPALLEALAKAAGQVDGRVSARGS